MLLDLKCANQSPCAGNSNPRYRWEQYWKTDAELAKMPKPIRKYYERNNGLIQSYMYVLPRRGLVTAQKSN